MPSQMLGKIRRDVFRHSIEPLRHTARTQLAVLPLRDDPRDLHVLVVHRRRDEQMTVAEITAQMRIGGKPGWQRQLAPYDVHRSRVVVHGETCTAPHDRRSAVGTHDEIAAQLASAVELYADDTLVVSQQPVHVRTTLEAEAREAVTLLDQHLEQRWLRHPARVQVAERRWIEWRTQAQPTVQVERNPAQRHVRHALEVV